MRPTHKQLIAAEHIWDRYKFDPAAMRQLQRYNDPITALRDHLLDGAPAPHIPKDHAQLVLLVRCCPTAARD